MKLFDKYWIAIIVIFVFFIFFKPVICYLIFGFILSYFGINSFILLEKLDTNGIKCKGKILSFESDNEGYKTPVVEFNTLEGELITGKPVLHTSTDIDKIRSYNGEVNTEVIILYQHEDPQNFILMDGQDLNYSSSILFSFTGLAFIIYTIYRLLS